MLHPRPPLGTLAPFAAALFLKGLHDALWVASLQLAVRIAELSLQVAAAAKCATSRLLW